MDYIHQAFGVRFEYNVYFTEHLFDPGNPTLKNFLETNQADTRKKIFFVIDSGVAQHYPALSNQISTYFSYIQGITLIPEFMFVQGGEGAKNDERLFYQIVEAVDNYGIDRHSYIAAVGGGSVLDMVGYAAAVSHRGIRHIRIPTTVLSQNDSGVGVKNGINYFGKKNFLGTFAPPVAVFNDSAFLQSLSDEEWRSGTSEAVKVSLIKDADFYEWLQRNAESIASRDMPAMKHLIRICAELHLQHIAGGDPFEMGSSRPLDFGHWSAHKLEQLSNFTIRHGEAVALGIALDTAYSYFDGRIKEAEAAGVIELIKKLGFPVSHPLMLIENEQSPVLKGLQEFREHLGGKLTIMLLESLGKGVEVHHLEVGKLHKASDWLNSVA
jgi:3-dehydroquinate synthase